jgi:hypothetical protein
MYLLSSWDYSIFFFKYAIDECKIVNNWCNIWSTCWVPNGYGPSSMGVGKISFPWVRVWIEFRTPDSMDMSMVFLYPTHSLPNAILTPPIISSLQLASETLCMYLHVTYLASLINGHNSWHQKMDLEPSHQDFPLSELGLVAEHRLVSRVNRYRWSKWTR